MTKPTADDLVRRLNDQDDECDGYSLYHEAADRIEQQATENARLNEELRQTQEERSGHWERAGIMSTKLRAAKAEIALLRAVVRAADAMEAAAIDTCQRTVDPSLGLIGADALNELIGIFDGPLQRAYDAARKDVTP